MASGGTIPTSREQLVSFYNTTGVIERDKNIYYAPRFTVNLGGDTNISDAFISWLHNSGTTPATDYTNIEISQWTPEDRELRVRGNIDDFRQGEGGLALNYAILKRTITIGNTTKVYRYGYFITGARQLGIGSIALSVEPDHFTNVFYLLNKDSFALNYEPFNKYLKNCYVNRQHYNRAKIDSSNRVVPDNEELFLNTEEQYKYKFQYRDLKTPISSYSNVAGNLSKEQLEIIESTNDFSNLPYDIKNFIVFSCISYVYVECKESILSPINFFRGTAVDESNAFARNWSKSGQKVAQFKSVAPNFIIPFIDIPNQFNKYSSWLEHISISQKAQFTYSGRTNLYYDGRLGGSELIHTLLNTSSWAQYIISANIIKGLNIVDYMTISFDSTTSYPTIKYNTKLVDKGVISGDIYEDVEYETGLYTTFIAINPSVIGGQASAQNSRNLVHETSGSDRMVDAHEYPQSKPIYNVLLLSGERPFKTQINVDLKTLSNNYMRNNYFDLVLDAEPYSFYTISYLGTIETTLYKSRYFQSYRPTYNDYTINIEIINSINNGLKVSILPTYKYNDNETRYYNEALVYTSNAMLPLHSDSYAEYYYNNLAQMKNQYAVAGVNAVQSGANAIAGGVATGLRASSFGLGTASLSLGAIAGGVGLFASALGTITSLTETAMNQKSRLADAGRQPDTIKQAGSNIYYDLLTQETSFYLNHYTIDETSYNSIAKFLERYGYCVNIYDTLHVNDRVGWNFIKLNAFDYEVATINPRNLSREQEDAIKSILLEGATLLHDKYYMTHSHNYETIFE